MKALRIVGLFSGILLAQSSTIFAQVLTEVGGFNKVEIFGKINVRLEKSENDSLFIESGNFDVNEVKYKVVDSVLSIKLLSEFPQAIKVNVTLNFEQINSLVVGGGANVYNRGTIESDFFTLDAKSGCELDLLVNIDSAMVIVNKGAFVRLTGENRFLSLKTNTGGDFRSTKMTNSIMIVKQNGGTAEVICSEYLDANVNFGATLSYVNQPKKIQKKQSFGGSIGKLEDF